MIVRSGGRDVEIRSASLLEDAWPYSLPPGPELYSGGNQLATGGAMSLERSLGVAALLGVLLRLSQLAGQVPMKVYQGPSEQRSAAGDTWQYDLLHNRPSSEVPPFAFYGNLALTALGTGYTCVRKYKSRGKVVDLLPLDSRKITPKRSGGRLVFEDRTEGGTAVTRDQGDIIFIPGIALPGSEVPFSPIAAHRLGVHVALTRRRYEARYFQRNAEPRVVLAFPQDMQRAEATEWVDLWDEEHRGEENWHGTSAIGGGATVTVVPVSMADAQFVEANNMSGGEIGAIYGMPKVFLNLSDVSPTQEDWRFLVTGGLGWVLTTMAQSFSLDRDIFPRELDPARRMFAEGVLHALLKPDIKTLYDAYRLARQAGWLTANEIRALENYPPRAEGDVLQATPVGGAVNSNLGGDPAKALSYIADMAPPEHQAIVMDVLRRAADDGVYLGLPA